MYSTPVRRKHLSFSSNSPAGLLNVILFSQSQGLEKNFIGKFINFLVIIFAENPIEIKKKNKILFLLEILLKMKNEKMKKKYDSLLE